LKESGYIQEQPKEEKNETTTEEKEKKWN
jgi:hypothetical protein